MKLLDGKCKRKDFDFQLSTSWLSDFFLSLSLCHFLAAADLVFRPLRRV